MDYNSYRPSSVRGQTPLACEGNNGEELSCRRDTPTTVKQESDGEDPAYCSKSEIHNSYQASHEDANTQRLGCKFNLELFFYFLLFFIL